MIFGTALALVTLPAVAQLDVNDLVKKCAEISSDNIRLICFDALAKSVADAPEGPATTNTKAAIVPAAPTTFKVVDTLDAYVAPRKFKGQGIEFRRMACFHADKDEYRCLSLTGETVIVFAKRIHPDISQAEIESECGTLKAVFSRPICRKTIRFVMADYDYDNPSPTSKRMVITAPTIEVVRPEAPAKRR